MKSEFIPGTEPFRPFTLTVETKEEADYLWHTIDCSNSQSLASYCDDRAMPHITDDVQMAVWKVLNEVYDLRR